MRVFPSFDPLGPTRCNIDQLLDYCSGDSSWYKSDLSPYNWYQLHKHRAEGNNMRLRIKPRGSWCLMSCRINICIAFRSGGYSMVTGIERCGKTKPSNTHGGMKGREEQDMAWLRYFARRESTPMTPIQPRLPGSRTDAAFFADDPNPASGTKRAQQVNRGWRAM